MNRFILIITLIVGYQSSSAQWSTIANSVDDFDFADNNVGYHIKVNYISPSQGFNSKVFLTNNGGLDWSEKYSKTIFTGYIERIFSEWIDTCFYYENNNGNLYVSFDEADNWDHFQFTDVHLSDISFLSSNTAYLTTNMVAYNSLSRIDEMNFQRIISTDTISFQAVCFITDSIGCFVSKRNEEYSIFRTQSPNTSWRNVFTTNLAINDIVFTSDSIGYAIGDLGTVLKTTDQGAVWNSLNTTITQNLNNLDYLDSETIFCAGDSGIVLKSIDGGESWEQYYLPHSDDLVKIKAFKNDQVFVLSTQKALYSNRSLSHLGEASIIDTKYSFYPNPFNDYIQFESKELGPGNIKILTIDGKLILTREFNNYDEFIFNTSVWEKGVYIIIVSRGMEITHFKLIKSNGL